MDPAATSVRPCCSTSRRTLPGPAPGAMRHAIQSHTRQRQREDAKGSGRIRAALHRLLASIPAIASFTLDERNPGVTRARF
jgi:hypothetical protein